MTYRRMNQNNGRTFSREEFYELVWKKPMTTLAKEFGLSDVGLRKVCIRHEIPTPPLGYWSKIAHGKLVRQSALPPKKSDREECILIATRPTLPAATTAAQQAALKAQDDLSSIVVATERSGRLHPLAVATAKALRETCVDHEGFKSLEASACVRLAIGPQSIDRVLRIIDAFARALEELGYHLEEQRGGIQVVVDRAHFQWRIHEIKDRKPHIPTKSELRAQTQHEANRVRYPMLYREKQIYRDWDYFPAGRLTMTMENATWLARWHEPCARYWRDRKAAPLEARLDEAMSALISDSVAANYYVSEEMERQRREEEERERIRQEQAKQVRARKRQEFILDKAQQYAAYRQLVSLFEAMANERQQGDQHIDRLLDETQGLIDTMGANFTAVSLSAELTKFDFED